MSRVFVRITCVLILFGALLLPHIALAHGRTEVGNYQFVIGFRNEPAYQGEPNGLDLRVTDKTTNEPVTGLEETLRVEIIFGSSKKELPLRARFGAEGSYTADVVPTEAGDYTWHIWGDVNGTPVDISMTSSPETFHAVRPLAEHSFPAQEPSTTELRAESSAAAQSAQTAMLIGGVGLAFGVIGLIVGGMGLRAASQARRA